MKRFAGLMLMTAMAVSACAKNDDASGNVDNVAVGDDMATNDSGAMDNMGSMGNADANASASADTAFLGEAIKGDNSEVAVGALAAAQGTSQKVKDFGQMLVTDHGAHKTKVATLLTGAGGTASDESTPEGKATLAKLKALKGAEFDKAFKAAAIEDHNKDIAKYEKQAAGTDAATAALAKETLPTLKKHLEAAKAL